MSGVANPQNFDQWLSASQDLAKQLQAKNTLPIISEYAFTNTNVTDYMELIKTTVVGGISLIPVIGNPISIMVSGIWSHLLSNNKETTFEIYSGYRDMIKATIDQSIDSYDNSAVKAVLVKINAKVEDFVKAKADYKLTPNNAAVKAELVDSFDDVLDEIRGACLPSSDLRKEGYEAQELCCFALMATLHLLLLKEGASQGATWGITAAKITTMKQDYNSNIVEYTTHCKLSYFKGVAKIKALGIDGVMQFNKLNYFRGQCARYVFDLVNLWTTFNENIFPNGCYYENVRYIFTDVIGRPIDPSQPAKPNKPYYYPSCDFLEKLFIDREFDLYQKEFKRVEFSNNDKYIYGVQSFYNDPSATNGEKVGEKIGNPNKSGGITMLPSNSNASVTTMSTGYDLLPRYLMAPNFISSNYNSTTLDLGQTYSTLGNVYDTEMDYISCHYAKDMSRGGYSDFGDRIMVNASVTNHKIQTIRGLNCNYECMNFDSGNDRSGVLDAMVIGLQPINVYNDNWLFNKIATVVNAQKYYNHENCKFARDFVLPTVHAMCINVGGKLRFRFKLKDTTITKYNLGIRYHYSNSNAVDGSISVRNANGVEILGGPVALAKCTPDNGSGVNEFKTKTMMAKVIDLTVGNNMQIALVAVGGPVYIHSIIMFPVQPTTAA